MLKRRLIRPRNLVIASVGKQESLCSASFSPKSADSSICNGFAISFEAATSWLHTQMHGEISAQYLEIPQQIFHGSWGKCSTFSSWCFLTPPDADSVRHKDWVLLGQLLRSHSGQLLAPIDKICLRTPGQDSFGLRGLEKRECKADKGLQGRNFFQNKEKNFSSKKSNMVIYF